MLATSAHASNATAGIVIGVRHVNAEGSRSAAAAPATSATTTESSSVVSVKPARDPGSGRSNGEAAATSVKLAVTTHEPTRPRLTHARGTGSAAALDKSGLRSAIQVPGTEAAIACHACMMSVVY